MNTFFRSVLAAVSVTMLIVAGYFFSGFAIKGAGPLPALAGASFLFLLLAFSLMLSRPAHWLGDNLGEIAGALILAAVLIINLKIMGVIDKFKIPEFMNFPMEDRPKEPLDGFSYNSAGEVTLPKLKIGQEVWWRKVGDTKYRNLTENPKDETSIEIGIFAGRNGKNVLESDELRVQRAD